MNREKGKIVILYVLLAVVCVRFAVAPLQNSLREKKALLENYRDAYRIKALQVERLKGALKIKAKADVQAQKGLLNSMYHKDRSITEIQSQVLKKVIDEAQKDGLTVVSFDIPDTEPGKNVSEVPVTIRFKGGFKPLYSLVRSVETSDKLLKISHLEIATLDKDNIFSLTLAAFRVEK